MSAAPPVVRVARQARWEARAVLANGEQLLVTLVLPAGVLVGTARAGIPDLAPLPQQTAALAGALGVAVLSAAFTGQAIAVGFDRRAGVLRLLGTTPLGRSGLLAGRALATAAVVALQALLLSTTAAALGVRPEAGLPLAVVTALPALALGTATFLAAGLLLAGTVRAEGVLGVANLLWVAAVALGGLVLPAERLPGGAVLALLPPGALGDALRAAVVDGAVALGPVAVLAAWGAGFAALAVRTFRWS